MALKAECAPALVKIARRAGQAVPEWLAKFESAKANKMWAVAKADKEVDSLAEEIGRQKAGGGAAPCNGGGRRLGGLQVRQLLPPPEGVRVVRLLLAVIIVDVHGAIHAHTRHATRIVLAAPSVVGLDLGALLDAVRGGASAGAATAAD